MLIDALSINTCILSPEAIEELNKIRILVVGVGGLGGFVAQGLVRLGAQNITVIDGDMFSDTNLNRQFFCNSETMGRQKAVVAVEEMLKVYPQGNYKAITEFITDKNAALIMKDYDIVFDCGDNIKLKLLLEDFCIKLGIPLIHAGVNANYGQLAIIENKKILPSLYRREAKNRNAVILPQVTSGLQLNLFVQYLHKKHKKNKLYLIDLDAMQISDINY